jgi:hypothetical protein
MHFDAHDARWPPCRVSHHGPGYGVAHPGVNVWRRGPPLGGRRRRSRTTATKTATTPMATTPGSRKLLGAGTGRGVSVGGGELAGGGEVAGGEVTGARAKPEQVTVTDVPGCPSEGASVISGLPTASFTVIAGS